MTRAITIAVALACIFGGAAIKASAQPELEVGECTQWLGGSRICRGGEGWQVIEELPYRYPMSVAAE